MKTYEILTYINESPEQYTARGLTMVKNGAPIDHIVQHALRIEDKTFRKAFLEGAKPGLALDIIAGNLAYTTN